MWNYPCLGLHDVLNSVHGSVIHAWLIWIPNFLLARRCCLKQCQMLNLKCEMELPGSFIALMLKCVALMLYWISITSHCQIIKVPQKIDNVMGK